MLGFASHKARETWQFEGLPTELQNKGPLWGGPELVVVLMPVVAVAIGIIVIIILAVDASVALDFAVVKHATSSFC